MNQELAAEKTIITEKKVMTQVKRVTNTSYRLFNTVDDNNYLTIMKRCETLFEDVFRDIEEGNLDKSLFLDFMNYVQEIIYLFELINLNDMRGKDLTNFLKTKSDYLFSLYSAIRNIQLADFSND